MSRVAIEGYPHAEYDGTSRRGFLAFYYPLYSPTPEDWRHESYSPEILNFKEGRIEHLQYFIQPFVQLVFAALGSSKRKDVILVPVPSSLAHDDPNFSRTGLA